MSPRVPQADPRRGYLARRADIDRAIARVLERGRYVLSDEVAAFEAEFAAYLGVRFAVGVASGTDALRLALEACGIERGDEVITVSHTAVATVAAIEMAGAVAVFVDVDPRTLTMDPRRVERSIGTRTRAIVPVHLYGRPASLTPLLEIVGRHGLDLIEDCAQAAGATLGDRKVGTFGRAAAFSFYPTKNLGAVGDGGMAVTGDPAVAARLKRLREYGWDEERSSTAVGVNSRLDELQAAILRVKLPTLDADNQRRRRIAERYREAFAGTSLVLPDDPAAARHVYHLYVVRSDERARIVERLAERGIGVAVHYPIPVHLQPAYRGRVRPSGLPVTERVAAEVVSLPMFPELGEGEVEEVIAAVLDAVTA